MDRELRAAQAFPEKVREKWTHFSFPKRSDYALSPIRWRPHVFSVHLVRRRLRVRRLNRFSVRLE